MNFDPLIKFSCVANLLLFLTPALPAQTDQEELPQLCSGSAAYNSFRGGIVSPKGSQYIAVVTFKNAPSRQMTFTHKNQTYSGYVPQFESIRIYVPGKLYYEINDSDNFQTHTKHNFTATSVTVNNWYNAETEQFETQTVEGAGLQLCASFRGSDDALSAEEINVYGYEEALQQFIKSRTANLKSMASLQNHTDLIDDYGKLLGFLDYIAVVTHEADHIKRHHDFPLNITAKSKLGREELTYLLEGMAEYSAFIKLNDLIKDKKYHEAILAVFSDPSKKTVLTTDVAMELMYQNGMSSGIFKKMNPVTNTPILYNRTYREVFLDYKSNPNAKLERFRVLSNELIHDTLQEILYDNYVKNLQETQNNYSQQSAWYYFLKDLPPSGKFENENVDYIELLREQNEHILKVIAVLKKNGKSDNPSQADFEILDNAARELSRIGQIAKKLQGSSQINEIRPEVAQFFKTDEGKAIGENLLLFFLTSTLASGKTQNNEYRARIINVVNSTHSVEHKR